MTKTERTKHKKTIIQARAAWERTGKPGGPDWGDWAKAWAEAVLKAAEALAGIESDAETVRN